MAGRAKYIPGMRLGNYQCPDGQIGILFLERIDRTWGMFECPYCHKPFKTQIGSIVNGSAHACKEHARFHYVNGQRIGDFVNPDGSVGMIFVKRIYDDNGKSTSYGEFICPIDGEHFNAEVWSVARGITRTSPKYAHTKYFPGMMLGNYVDRNTGEPYGVKFVERVSEYRGVFECHYCHEKYETEIKAVIDGHSSQCSKCYHLSQRKYNEGDYIGKFKHNGVIGTKLIERINSSTGRFECPICHEQYNAEYSSVVNGERPICPECKTKLRNKGITHKKVVRKPAGDVKRLQHKGHGEHRNEPKQEESVALQYMEYDGTIVNRRRGYGPNTKIDVLTGKRSGHLVALYPLDGYTRGNFVVWKCRCDCGNYCTRTSLSLLHPTKYTSCGCIAHKIHDQKIEKNYEGIKQGCVTVLKKIGVYDGYMQYRCKCECDSPCDDQLFTVRADRITAGIEYKPGCQKSIGEARIEEILRDLHISYTAQATFDTLINPKTGKKLLCDFYLPDKNMVIEFDGRQHYQESPQWGGKTRVVESMYYDGIKNDWCAQHGITMVRIPYCYRDDLSAAFLDNVINEAYGKKLVMLPMKNKSDDQRLSIMYQLLADVIAAVAEQKRVQESEA